LIERHRLPLSALDRLAAGPGDLASFEILRTSQLSKRLLAIRALIEPAQDGGGEVADVVALLVEVQKRHSDTVTDVLTDPAVGAWVGSALRSQPPRTPGPAHILGAVAVAAAIRAGQDFTVRIRVGDCGLPLPTLGHLRVPQPADGMVSVRSAAGHLHIGTRDARITLSDLARDSPWWSPLRRLTPDAGGSSVQLALDDLGWYGDAFGFAVAGRLTDADVVGWQRLMTRAWRLLVADHGPYVPPMAAGLRSLVPLQRGSGWGHSASSRSAFGAMALTSPAAPKPLAETMVHEFQHAKLGALLDLVDLYDTDDRRRFYSPWRDDPRPIGGVLQGAYAYLGVSDFWRVRRTIDTDGRLARFQFARAVAQVRRALEVFEASGRATELGIRFVNAMTATMDGWDNGDADHGEIRQAAEDTVDDHRAAWLLANGSVDEARVDHLARAWLSGAHPAELPRSEMRAPNGEPALPTDVRVQLAQLRAVDPAAFEQVRDDPAALRTGWPMATAGDLTFAQRDFPQAYRRYAEALAADPEDGHAWSGLVLSGRRCGSDECRRTWTLRPDLVRAVWSRLRDLTADPPEPDRVAGWIGRSLGREST
jgi:HEXXH motif-containing protein